MALVPGAMDSGGGTQKSIRIAGRGGDDNNFRFDGMDATGISNQAPNTSTRLQISTEAIAEFKVDTMLYGADTGGTNGGQVEVISNPDPTISMAARSSFSATMYSIRADCSMVRRCLLFGSTNTAAASVDASSRTARSSSPRMKACVSASARR